MLGSIIDMRSKRPDDPNDRYRHRHRRELRGLYALCSWVGSWDTKDHQSLETFVEREDTLGFVRHNLLDFGASLGAAAEGPRPPERGYEYTVDYKWSLRRLFTLGFPGPDYDYDRVRSWLAWRDAKNG